MQEHSEANQRWKNQLEEFRQSSSYRELFGMDGEPIEFEWNVLHGFSSLQILQKIEDDSRERNIELEKFTDRIIFMSMRFRILEKKSRNTRKDSCRNIGRFSVLETKRNGTELSATHLMVIIQAWPRDFV